MAAGNDLKDKIDSLANDLATKADLEEKEEEFVTQDLLDIAKALVVIIRDSKYDIKGCRGLLIQISNTYRNQLGNQTAELRPDFNDLRLQWCYMYCYMLHHAYLLFYSVRKAVEDNFLKINVNGNSLNVCAIGGGPGSDILGLCLLLKKQKCQKPWICQVNVLDKFVKWENSWKILSPNLPEQFKDNVQNVCYSQFDFTTEKLEKDNQKRIETAHIVTMTKSLSSAAAWFQVEDTPLKPNESSGQTNRNSIFSILETMQNGAILLYLDNPKGPQSDILMKAANHFNFETLYETKLESVEGPKIYEGIDLEFRNNINWQMSRKSNGETFKILKKPGTLSTKVKLEAMDAAPATYSMYGLKCHVL